MPCLVCGSKFLNMDCPECLTLMRDLLEDAGFGDLAEDIDRRADRAAKKSKKRRVKRTSIPGMEMNEDGDLKKVKKVKEDTITDSTIDEYLK